MQIDKILGILKTIKQKLSINKNNLPTKGSIYKLKIFLKKKYIRLNIWKKKNIFPIKTTLISLGFSKKFFFY